MTIQTEMPFGHVEDPARAELARDRAMARADDAACRTWKDGILEAIHDTAVGADYLTTDDVWRALEDGPGPLPTTHEPRALGPLMRRAQALQWITPTGEWALSRQTACHRRPKRVWRSLIRGRDAVVIPSVYR